MIIANTGIWILSGQKHYFQLTLYKF